MRPQFSALLLKLVSLERIDLVADNARRLSSFQSSWWPVLAVNSPNSVSTLSPQEQQWLHAGLSVQLQDSHSPVCQWPDNNISFIIKV
jgi:hypothetical protein